MLNAQTLDAEITRMYTTGESTMTISKELGLRPAEVISRVRALNLMPPGMGFRRAAEPVARPAAAQPALPASPAEPPRPTRPRAEDSEPARPRRSATAATEADDEPDGFGDLATLPGRPRGWLVTEIELAQVFRAQHGRFEDVRLRTAR